MRQVLSVTSECIPLVKTGGLADVAGALPGAMRDVGWEMKTLLPGYPEVMAKIKAGKTVLSDKNLFGGAAKVVEASGSGLKLFVLVAPHLYERDGLPYGDASGKDWPDNPERFAALCKMAARIGSEGAGDWLPDIVHCHDWQAGLTPLYLSQSSGHRPGTIMTIHNIAFHGFAPKEKIGLLGLPRDGFTQDGYEYWDQISALKAGLVWSDKLTTVSPTYAKELMRAEFGMGLDGLLQSRSNDLVGILNGIDDKTWDPATDPEIANYKTPRGKRTAKTRLRREFGLPVSDGPLCVVVSRLSHQKGLDLLLEALPALVDRGGQLALLGSGDKELERRFAEAAASHKFVSARIGYDEALSHRMIAGADAILVPSRFEPCGLTQLYGLRYGTVPVVAYTGGLVDTVIPVSPMTLRGKVATGIQFHPATSDALARALMQAVDLFADKPVWEMLQKNGMRQTVGWQASAAEYASLYEKVAPAL
ncbi:MAG: glycogen synthase GlgA [Rhodobacteraceae bacterium]|nr:glycogen synthase GlgA [Paracoccaceae bacterium]